MLIDLHVHTKKCKEGDSDKRNVDVSLFKKKVLLSAVSVLGITNHNHFDLEQYQLFREAVKDNCDVWPGVEFDVKQLDSKSGHVIVIVNPEYAVDFSDKVKEIVGSSSADNFVLSVDDLTTLFNDFEPVFIPHYLKPKSIGPQDLERLEEKVYLKTRLIKEPSNIASIGVLNSYDHKCLLGSDVKDWNEYEKGSFSELKFDFTGYRNFLKLLDKNVPYINDLLNKAYTQKVTVYGMAKNSLYPYQIDCYNDVNIIFGDRGSGKSEIIKSLSKYYNDNSISCLEYKGEDKDAWFSDLLDVDINDYSYTDVGLSSNEAESFSFISDYQDILPIPVSSYTHYFKNQTDNKNASKIKIIKLSRINDCSLNKISILWNDYYKIKQFLKSFEEMTVYKSNPDKYAILVGELKKAMDDSFELYKKQWINYYSNSFYDKSIDVINTAISECVGHPPVPTKTGFFEFAINRLKLLANIKSIKNVLGHEPRELSNKYVGSVGDKGIGKIVETIQFINERNIDNIDNKFQNSKKTRYNTFFRCLNTVESSIFGNSLPTNISELKNQMLINTIQDVDYFLCATKCFTLNGDPYNPSKGEKCILSMQYELVSVKDNYSVFLLDEPESGLGNDYIEHNIVTLIKDLAKSGKTVFVVTHNANIAVRTLPATSILKIVDNGKYITYQGSMFTNKMTNIANPDDVKTWNTESETHLEGGKKAFEERGYYYAETD